MDPGHSARSNTRFLSKISHPHSWPPRKTRLRPRARYPTAFWSTALSKPYQHRVNSHYDGPRETLLCYFVAELTSQRGTGTSDAWYIRQLPV